MTGARGWTLLAIVAIALGAGALAASPAFDALRGLSLDGLTALRWRLIGNPQDPSSSPAVVVAFDRDTYRAPPLEGTPTLTWTREIGRVVTALIDGGAKVVGFDVVFPTSIEESQISFNDETIGARMRGFDRDFLRALALGARAGKVVLGEVQHGDDLILPSSGQRAAVGQQRNIRSLNVYDEADGVVRRVPLMLAAGEASVPSMSLELAARALGAAPQTGADHGVTLAGYHVPTAVPNAMTLNFDGGSNDIPTYSFADLRECLEKGDAEFFRRNFAGKVVLFGSELGFEDGKLTSKRFATAPAAPPAERCARPAIAAPEPSNLIDGVYVHATAVNNLVRRDAIAELGPIPRWLIATAGGGVATLAAFLLTPAAAALAFVLLALAWTAVATAAFADALALPLLEPLAAGLIAIVATTGFRLFVTDRDKRFLRRAFEFYLAPSVIEKMLTASRPPTLGGEIRNVTVFFSDLAGFSGIAEAMKPAELVSLMNRYLSAMTDVIEAHGGFVDKYIGDAIVAAFGAPVEGADDATQAVRAALACLAELNKLNEVTSGPILVQRIGLNSGQALVGNIGSRRQFNYTVMGDSVNLASRLEGANKYFGTAILASESTMALTGAAFAWREIDAIRVKGRSQPVRVFEPLGEAGGPDAERLRRAAAYGEGLALWRKRHFSGAAQRFALGAGSDPPSALFLARAEKLSRDPPQADWEPVQTLEEK